MFSFGNHVEKVGIPGAPMTDTPIGNGSSLLVTMESYLISPTEKEFQQIPETSAGTITNCRKLRRSHHW
jgi:hypothetical protein